MTNIDTVTYRDIEIFVRYSPSIVGDSARLTINTIAPDSMAYDEEITILFDRQIAERGASRLHVVPYRQNVVWRQRGAYTIEITPTHEILGVEAIGINTIKN